MHKHKSEKCQSTNKHNAQAQISKKAKVQIRQQATGHQATVAVRATKTR